MEAPTTPTGSDTSDLVPEPLRLPGHESLPLRPLLDDVPNHGLLPLFRPLLVNDPPASSLGDGKTFNAKSELPKIVMRYRGPPETDPISMVVYANLTLNEGDTLVYIDIPASPEDQRKRATCHGILPASQHFWVHSEKLFALADSKFPPLLDNAIYQARVKRRRKPTEEMLKGVKYLLDLTPPVEGDDLVFQISELSLTPGIIKWWNAVTMLNADPSLVSGHDDVCCCNNTIPSPKPDNNDCGCGSSPTLDIPQDESHVDQNNPGKQISVPLPPGASDLLLLKTKGQDVFVKTPAHFQIPDYCVIRHCHSIIRFMLMIEGKNVNLNSAARVWSMVAISKIFEAPSVVRDQVATWIMSNTIFIEVLPEEALRIGYRLELPEITQSAFRILVNELALEEAAEDFEARRPRRRVTVFGRRIGVPDDETANVIQHAARALIDRLANQYEESVTSSLFDRLEIGEWNKMREVERILEQEDDEAFTRVLLRLRSLMKEIRIAITNNLETASNRSSKDYELLAKLDDDRACYMEPKDFEQLRYILERFNTTQRLLCPFLSTTIGNDLAYLTNDVYYKQEAGALARELWTTITRSQELRDWSSWGISPQNQGRTDWSAWGSFVEPFDTRFRIEPVYRLKEPLFCMDKLRSDLEFQLPIARTWDRISNGFPFALPSTRHMLLTLTGNEIKYLPLWAGGNDDGTGGVFEEFLPPAEMGPNGPGPAYHTGQTLPSDASSISGSLMDDITAMKIAGSTAAGSTVPRSMDAQDGISTVYRPGHVISLGSSIASESFEDDASEFGQAMLAVPADHQELGALDDLLMSDDMYDDDDDDDDDAMSEATITTFGDDSSFEDGAM